MNNINININLGSFEKVVQDVIVRFSHLSLNDVVWMVGAVVLPPLAVVLKVGFTVHFWINVVLTLMGYVPGQIHALWVVLFMK